jgi:hypothetical protein
MRVFESKTHSFIVKIWLEEPEGPGGAKWRGHITHVPGNERRYIEQLGEIADFIAPYVEGMKASSTGCIRRWLKAHMSPRRKQGG